MNVSRFYNILGRTFFVFFFSIGKVPTMYFLDSSRIGPHIPSPTQLLACGRTLPGLWPNSVAWAAGPMRAELNSPESRGQRLCCVRMLKECGQGRSGLWTLDSMLYKHSGKYDERQT